MPDEQSDVHIVVVILAQQYNLKKGLELFGEKADAALDRHENRKGWCRGIGRGDRTSRRNQMASQCQWYC